MSGKSSQLLPHIRIEPKQGKADACIIGLHGLGADGYDFQSIVSSWEIPASTWKFRYVFPHAPSMPITINRGMSMPAWFDILTDAQPRFASTSDVQSSLAKIFAFIEHERNMGIAENRIIISGFSQGACMALLCATRYKAESQGLGAIVALSGRVLNPREIEEDRAPAFAKEIPIFMSHGMEDDVLPYEAGKKSARLLQKKGYALHFSSYSRLAHSLDERVIHDINGFLKTKVIGRVIGRTFADTNKI